MLNTGRLLEHWHTGSMTRRSFALDTIAPRAEVYLHPDDAREPRAGRRRHGPGPVAARRDRAARRVSAPRGARQRVHPVPLPGGRREPADHRRDRPGREDPGVQVLRRRSRARWRRRRDRRDRGGTGARRRGPGRPVPRAQPDPGAARDPGAASAGCPARSWRRSRRDTRRPLYEIQGLVSFYPHFRTEPPPRVALHLCHDLSCWLRERRRADRRAARAVRRRPRRRGPRGVLPGPLRDRPRGRGRRPAGAGRRPPPTWSRPATGRAARRVRTGRRRSAGPTTPTTRAAPRYQVLRDLLAGRRYGGRGGRDPDGLRAARDGRRRLPDREEVVARRRPGGRPRRTPCATPTSPSPAPSRTGRSWPTSRTWCSRACCSAWSWSAPRRAGSSSGTSTGRRPTCCGPSSTGCAARGCSGTTCSAPGGGSRSRCSCRPAATSSARSRRCSSAWRATAASRGTSRRSPACTACGASRP